MGTTKEEIRGWLNTGKERGATHVVVVCDTFDHGDYPVYVMPDKNVSKVVASNNNPDAMTRVMEVYALHLDFDKQLNERRAYHLEYASGPGNPDAKIAHAKGVERTGSVGPSTRAEPSSPSTPRRTGEVQTKGQPGETGLSSDLVTSFFVEVGVMIEINRAMVERFRDLSQAHYDGACRRLSEHGGFIYGWLNIARLDDDDWRTQVPITDRQLNFLCKLLELERGLDGVTEENALAGKFVELQRAVIDQRVRLNRVANTDQDSSDRAVKTVGTCMLVLAGIEGEDVMGVLTKFNSGHMTSQAIVDTANALEEAADKRVASSRKRQR